ncbi:MULTISPECIES: hypothetical protein [Halobacillus]|nr:hypothetical protein [Halobacillus litoralis]
MNEKVDKIYFTLLGSTILSTILSIIVITLAVKHDQKVNGK